MGSLRSCGGAENNPGSESFECRVPMPRHGRLALAEKVRFPPFATKAARLTNGQNGLKAVI